MSLEELKEALKNEKNLTIGKETTLKQLKLGRLKHVYLSSTCEKNLKEDVEHYAKISGIKCEVTGMNSEELGILCKKPFNIQIVGIKKKIED